MVYRRKGRSRRRARFGRTKRVTRKYVQKAIHRVIEDKYVNQSLTTSLFSSIPAAWQEVNLVSMSQGVNEGERIGNKIRVTAFQFYGVLSGGQTNSVLDDNRNFVRIVLCTATYPSPLLTAVQGVNSPIQRDSCNVLLRKYWDKVVTLDSPGRDSVGYMPPTKIVKYYKRFKKPIDIIFANTGAGTSGKFLTLSMISDSGAVPNPGFVQGFYKLHYEDA